MTKGKEVSDNDMLLHPFSELQILIEKFIVMLTTIVILQKNMNYINYIIITPLLLISFLG